MRCVALDEAHEMCVNKDLKTTIVRRTKKYIDRILYYFPVRSHALKVRKEQLLIGTNKSATSTSLFNHNTEAVKLEGNISAMRGKLLTSSLVVCTSTTSTQSLGTLSGTVASPEQEMDLLEFWDIGKICYGCRVRYFILKEPSAKVPQRQARLLTFGSSKKLKKVKLLEKEQKLVYFIHREPSAKVPQRPTFGSSKKLKKVKLLEKEQKLVATCLRRTLAWNSSEDRQQLPVGEQYLVLPRAISDPNGIPHKGVNSNSTKWLERRYKTIVHNKKIPQGLVPGSYFGRHVSDEHLSSQYTLYNEGVFQLSPQTLCFKPFFLWYIECPYSVRQSRQTTIITQSN